MTTETQAVLKLARQYAIADGNYRHSDSGSSALDERLFAKAEATKNALEAAIEELHTPPPTPHPTPAPTNFEVLAITTAYEQGVGKGRKRTIANNPYAQETCFGIAWMYGYEEGKGMEAQPVIAPEWVMLTNDDIELCDTRTLGCQHFGRAIQAAFITKQGAKE